MKFLIFIGLKLAEIIGVIGGGFLLLTFGNFTMELWGFILFSSARDNSPWILTGLVGLGICFIAIVIVILIIALIVQWFQANIELTTKIYNKIKGNSNES